jgi:hypothetical protein
MNMAFSGVAGSRPARGLPLADGDGQRTIKGVNSSYARRPGEGRDPYRVIYRWREVADAFRKM